MTDMLNMLQDPSMYVLQMGMQQLIKENPEAWQQAQQMFEGKSHTEQVKSLRKLYKSKGMDLDATAKRYGVML